MLQSIKVPHCFLLNSDAKIMEIATFCDASAKAFLAVIYVIAVSKDGTCTSSLAYVRTWVRPLGKKLQKLTSALSICRLELRACLLGAQATNYISAAFHQPLEKKFFSNSQITLYRLGSDIGKYKPFVANRLKKIKELTSQESWHYIDSKTNYGARSADLSEFISNKLWWSGPSFLTSETHNYKLMQMENIKISKEQLEFEKEELKRNDQQNIW